MSSKQMAVKISMGSVRDSYQDTSMAIKVVKFGGSSLADARQIQKAAAIIQADPQRRYCVYC